MSRGTLLFMVLAAVTAMAAPDALASTSLPEAPMTVAPRVAGQDTFPHVTHQGLFPLCQGCHVGVATGDEAAFYPAPASCNGCHNGTFQRLVEWAPPVPGAEPALLEFTHPAHSGEVVGAGAAPLECSSCHVAPGGTSMAVVPLQAERCLDCHGDPPELHVSEAPCASCHVPLAESDLPTARIASLEEPPDHEGDGFLAGEHGNLVEANMARCATCHTQDQCVACHVDPDVSAIQSFPAAGPQMVLPPTEARYPVPSSHESSEFEREHGPLSLEVSCSTCHTREDCASCHLAPLPETAAALPARTSGGAPGVQLGEEAPSTHGSPFFREDHASLAASEAADCATCHTTAYCVACHAAPQQPEFHPLGYVASHQADAWNQTAECANCHDTQAFCRSCHVDSGLQSVGRLGRGYHDAEPMWLLRHGQAARQSLESCASCHTQRNCLQCHSELGAFQVNPHRSGFDAQRAWEQTPRTCFACHVGNPL